MVETIGSKSAAGEVAKYHGQGTDKVDKAVQARKQQQAALFRHDLFNLVALAIVNSLNCWYLLYGRGTNLLLAGTDGCLSSLLLQAQRMHLICACTTHRHIPTDADELCMFSAFSSSAINQGSEEQ
jgi:hypothetical protein